MRSSCPSTSWTMPVFAKIIHDFDQDAPRSGKSAVTTTQVHAVLHEYTVNYAGVTHKSQGRGPPRRSSRPDRRSSVAKACTIMHHEAVRLLL